MTGSCEAMAGVAPYNVVRTQYRAVITQPVSGTYSITTRGTDVNLDPCDDLNPHSSPEFNLGQGSCRDATNTGFVDQSGDAYTCAELRPYCHDSTYGQQVRSACPLTCGTCEVAPPAECATLPTSMGRKARGLWDNAIPGNYSFPLSFPACGAACAQPPAIAHAASASMAVCDGKFDGYICSFSCADGYMPTGSLTCSESCTCGLRLRRSARKRAWPT